MRKLLIALVVLVVLLVAADRIGVAVAENQISDRIASSYGLDAKPQVTITGFPFLTQVVAGDYQQINVSVSQIQADGATLHDLNVHLMGVHATVGQLLGNGSSMVTADRATGTAIVGFGTVNKRLPAGLHVEPDGDDLTVSGNVSYHGLQVPVKATVALGVSGSGVTVRPVNVTVAGGISLPAVYASQLRAVVPLGQLPLHLHLTSVRVTPGGLQIGASAQNVQFART
jgi:LmeA-like phospholipid-binding